ncbi:MAG: hypothetical protein U9N79_05675 [Actinomycetota bacterium]|nr:hypothetical protein [Actinomycetota bacterium]
MSARTLVIVAVALATGFAAGITAVNVLDDSAGDPASTMAPDIGVALPIEQYDAFTDGVITFAEVDTAAEAVRQCVDDTGFTGYTLTTTEVDGWSASYDDGIESDRDVEHCMTRHFRATHDVYQWQKLQG